MTLRVGALAISSIYDGQLRGAAHEFYGMVHGSVLESSNGLGTRAEDWLRWSQFLAPDGSLDMPIGGYLVRGCGERVILVDLGIGMMTLGPASGGQFLQSLTAEGVAAEDVTDVILTHLHLDHVGWAATGDAKTFPNAQYWCHRAETDQHDHGPADGRPALGRVGDRLDIFDGDFSLAPGIIARHAPGHTSGSVVVEISSGGERALLLGDAAHNPVELCVSSWVGMGDADPDQALCTRRALAEEALNVGALIGSQHFPGMSLGRLEDRRGRIVFTPASATV